MTLTVKEKEHWRGRISRKIDQAIEVLQASEDPGFMERIKRQAKQHALKSLGIDKLTAEVEEIEAEKDLLETRRKRIVRQMLATIRGCDEADVSGSLYGEPPEVSSAIQRRQSVHASKLLEEHPLGRRIQRLLREKEELLDTVWLATSPTQIRQLWSDFAKLLNCEPTEFQKKALAIDPADSDEPST